MSNRFFIAAAGSGKTQLIVNEVLEKSDEKILITTFTIANAHSIRERIARQNGGFIPSNVVVQTWFSFLLEHGVRPYRFWTKRDEGIELVNGQTKNFQESQLNKDGTPNHHYYFKPRSMVIPSDRLSHLVVTCNQVSQGSVISRLENIYDSLYIDECQDMAAWDLEVFKLLLSSSINLTLVGDPRQAVYNTSPSSKYKKYANGKIKEFLESKECRGIDCLIDITTLNKSYRNSAAICNLSSMLYPDIDTTTSGLSITSEHMGIFFVKDQDLQEYAAYVKSKGTNTNKTTVAQLRNDIRTKGVLENVEIWNFGKSKGLEFEHIILHPTAPMKNWFFDTSTPIADTSKAGFYVALTRAFFSVAIIVKEKDVKKKDLPFPLWSAE